jgi:hypothetical protein
MIFLGQPGSPQVLTACVVAQLGGCGRYTPILPPPFPHRPFSQMNSPVKKLYPWWPSDLSFRVGDGETRRSVGDFQDQWTQISHVAKTTKKEKKIGCQKEHQRGRVKSDGTKFTHLSYYSLFPILLVT